MESLPQNPEFGNNSENFHPCIILTVSNMDGNIKKMPGPSGDVEHLRI